MSKIAPPPRIDALPKIHGEPELWFMTHEADEAIEKQVCYLCGEPFGSYKAFALTPEEVMRRHPSFPPSHTECMLWGIGADAIGDPLPIIGEHEPKILAVYVVDTPWDPPSGITRLGPPANHNWFVNNQQVSTSEQRMVLFEGCAVALRDSIIRASESEAEAAEVFVTIAERYRWMMNNLIPGGEDRAHE